MKLSVWSAYLMEMSPEKMVNTFVEHNYKYTEISDEHGLELLKRGNPEKTGSTLRKYAVEQGFSFPQGHLWLKADIVEPSQNRRLEITDKLKQWLELYNALGVKAAVLHPGGAKARAEGWPKEKISEVRTESLRVLTDFIKDMPVTIAMENCGENSDGLSAIIDAVGSDHLGICLDTGHLNLIGEKQSEFIKKFGNRLIALHIADNLGSYDNHMLPYSAGTVDWNDITGALKEINCSGLFNFEVPGEMHCSLEIRLAKLDYILQLGKLMTA